MKVRFKKEVCFTNDHIYGLWEDVTFRPEEVYNVMIYEIDSSSSTNNQWFLIEAKVPGHYCTCTDDFDTIKRFFRSPVLPKLYHKWQGGYVWINGTHLTLVGEKHDAFSNKDIVYLLDNHY